MLFCGWRDVQNNNEEVFQLKYIIRDNQAGFVLKNGVFQKMITAGTWHFSKMAGYTVAVEEMLGEMDYLEVPYQVLSRDPAFREATVHMEIPDGCIGFLYMNGKLTSFATRKDYVFWNVFDKYEMKVISMENTLIGEEITKQMLTLVPKNLYTEMSVGEGEVGLAYYDNVMQSSFPMGVYRFWNHNHGIRFCVIDMKQRELDIVGQEILTRDKIGIRLNAVCMYRVRDAVEFVSKISDLKGQLYPAVQLAIREIVGNYKLDELLEAKERISGEIFQALKAREDMFCVSFLTAGIKDIILPGEIREIMNSVLVAEKAAQANVIARREEVASTRSLLNTAKLMDENQTLYKLKELEYLEKICEKVGEISVNGSAGIVEQLGRMMGTGR